MKTRREFIKEAASGSCMLLAGSSLLFLTGAASFPIDVEGSEFQVPLSSFGSSDVVIVKHKKQGNILVRKTGNSAFEALSLKCTHKGGKVVESGSELKCTKHGSKFDKSGKVTKGPAKLDLPKFPASLQGDNVVVKVG